MIKDPKFTQACRNVPLIDITTLQDTATVEISIRDARCVLAQDYWTTNICNTCWKPGAKHCSTCHLTRYCNRQCQKADWKRHKQRCCQRPGVLEIGAMQLVGVSGETLDGQNHISPIRKHSLRPKQMFSKEKLKKVPNTMGFKDVEKELKLNITMGVTAYVNDVAVGATLVPEVARHLANSRKDDLIDYYKTILLLGIVLRQKKIPHGLANQPLTHLIVQEGNYYSRYLPNGEVERLTAQ